MKIKVKAWIVSGQFETNRGYSYIHIQDKRPEHDTDYISEEVFITYTVPQKKGKR